MRPLLEKRLFCSVSSFCKTKGYCYWKHNFWRLSVWNPASTLLQIDQEIRKMTMTLQFYDMTSLPIFFWSCFVFLVKFSYCPRSMSISSLVLLWWQFSFIRDWPEIRKSEIHPSEFCPISEDWGKLWIPNLARMSLIECYWMLQNSRVTAFTVFELLGENQLWGKLTCNINRKGNKYIRTT